MILTAPHLMLALRWLPPAVALTGSVVLYMPIWALLKIITWPFSERVFRRADEYVYGNYQALVGFFYETWSGVEFHFYGDPLPQTPENVLYFSNHQCTVDWVIVEVLCLKQGGYGGRARYILKDALKYVPLYGWQLGDRGGIYIKRQKDRDQQKLISGLNNFVKKDIPVWLVIFPEGTRFDPQNRKAIERSHEFARNLGLPELKHVLTPRTTGFELALGHIRDHFKAVYDITIYYESFGQKGIQTSPPNMFGFFSGQCAKVHIHIKRIPIEEIPMATEHQRAWLYDAYERKDRMIENCLTKGSFDAPKVGLPLPLSLSGPPTLFFVGILIGTLSCHYGQLWFLGTMGFFSTVGILKMALKS